MTRDELRLIECKIVGFICAGKVLATTCENFGPRQGEIEEGNRSFVTAQMIKFNMPCYIKILQGVLTRAIMRPYCFYHDGN